MDKEAKKKKKRKYTDKALERADDLAERMMASEDFKGDWESAFALSRWMLGKKTKNGKPYEVKNKPGKPHKKYVPKKKKKNKKSAELIQGLIQLADTMDTNELYKDADTIDGIIFKLIQDSNNN